MTDEPLGGFDLLSGADHRELARIQEAKAEALLLAPGDDELRAALLDGRAEKYRDGDGNLKARMKGTGPHDY